MAGVIYAIGFVLIVVITYFLNRPKRMDHADFSAYLAISGAMFLFFLTIVSKTTNVFANLSGIERLVVLFNFPSFTAIMFSVGVLSLVSFLEMLFFYFFGKWEIA
jgi:hypothetical protein